MVLVIPSKPFDYCPKCGKKGYKETNDLDGTPIKRCKYCGLVQPMYREK